MIVTIQKLNVFSFALMQAKLLALIGLLLGIIYAFGGLVIDSIVSMNLISIAETPGLSMGTLLAFGALIGMPLIGLVSGYILGIIEAILFNLTTTRIGGIKLNFNSPSLPN